MQTLFIADLHLCPTEPAITAGFLRFLQQQAVNANALYILGDLFEVWIGDDENSLLQQQVSQALKQLQQHGVSCYFIHGNRDFLLGQQFAQAAAMIYLPEQHVITLYGQRILLLHGDLLCTDDQEYQRFRRYMHNRWLQWLFLHSPLSWRQRLARQLRQRSQQRNHAKSEQIMDVNPQAVQIAIEQHHVAGIIHGHTHRPEIHYLAPPASQPFRAVLGAWHQQGSVIRLNQYGITLDFFPLNAPTD